MVRKTLQRTLLLIALLAVAGSVAYLLYGTPWGEQLREDRETVRAWVDQRPALSIVAFVIAYAVVGIFALPVWWVQVIGGYCFGLVNGVVLCHLGAVLATFVTMRTSCWLLGEWFHSRVEPYHARLREIDEKMGHNGLLVVTAIRLSHFMPFGISNYLMGISKISLSHAIVGTILGGTFSKAMWVATGADAGLLRTPWFWFGMLIINALLLSPLIVRYWRPQWFARVGVE